METSNQNSLTFFSISIITIFVLFCFFYIIINYERGVKSKRCFCDDGCKKKKCYSSCDEDNDVSDSKDECVEDCEKIEKIYLGNFESNYNLDFQNRWQNPKVNIFGVEIERNLGTKGAKNKYSLSYQVEGLGVKGNANGTDDYQIRKQQLQFDPYNNLSEEIIMEFEYPVIYLDVELRNLFSQEYGLNECALIRLFDFNNVELESFIVCSNDNNGFNNFEIFIPNKTIYKIIFEALPYNDNPVNNIGSTLNSNSSDYFINKMEIELCVE